jgi:hypothetical protein
MATRKMAFVDYLILVAAVAVGLASVVLFFLGLPWAVL